MQIYAMTRKRISPEVNALSSILFITVLAPAAHSELPGDAPDQAGGKAEQGPPKGRREGRDPVMKKFAILLLALLLASASGRLPKGQTDHTASMCTTGARYRRVYL